MASSELSRLDLRLPRKQKELFEQALEIGGFRSLTDFILTAVSEKAEEILERHKTLLASEADRKVFFDALLNPPSPNSKLIEAMKSHRRFNTKG